MLHPPARAAATLAAAAALLAAGCGGSAGPPTETLRKGVEVSAGRYLADVAAGRAAVREFVSDLAPVSLARAPTPGELRRIAPKLQAPLAAALLVAERLDAAHLADERLEAQRAATAPRYLAVTQAMGSLAQAAQAGDARAASSAVTTLRAAVGSLRSQR